MNKRSCITIPLFITIAISSQAALTEWRPQVQVSAGSGNNTQFAFDGGLNVASAAQTIAYAGALSEASAELSAGGYVPTLRTRATANPTRSQAVGWRSSQVLYPDDTFMQSGRSILTSL